MSDRIKANNQSASETALDVTADKHRELALFESEERFRKMFERHSAIMLLIEPKSGDIVDANRAAACFYKYSCEKLRTMTIQDLNKLSASEVAVLRQNTIENGEGHYLLEHRLADNQSRWVEVYSTPIEVHGRILLFSVIHNINDRKQTEAELQRINRLYEVLSLVNIGLVRSDSQSAFLKAACRAITAQGGFKLAWVGRVDWETMVVPIDAYAGEAFEYLDKLLVYADERPEGKGPTGIAIREKRTYVCNDFFADPMTIPWRAKAECFGIQASIAIPITVAEEVWGALTVYAGEPEFFQEREVALMEEVAGNIAFGLVNLERDEMRRRAEETLRESEERFRVLFTNMEEGVALHELIFDSEEKPVNYRLMDTNPSFEKMLGIKRSDVIGKLATEAYGTAEAPYLAEYGAVGLSGTANRMEVYFPPMRRYFDISIAPWGDRRFATIFTDITERKLVEEQLLNLNADLEQRVVERTKQLEVSNQEMEAFAYSVSHDLRSPLRAVDGYSQILLEDYATMLDKDGLDCLERIRSGVQRMASLIDDLLHLSRLSRAEMKITRVNLSEMVQSIADELKEAQPQRDMVFVIEPDVIVQADPGLIRIALENLLQNAGKFTGKQENARIEFGTERLSGEQVIFIRDNGAGFDMAYISKLFGVFQRLHSAQEFQGIGIGLATVQRIVRRHAGRIWAEGAVNQGATFYFTLQENEL